MYIGGYCPYYDRIIHLIRLKFGTEMSFDPGKTLVRLGLGALILPWQGRQKIGLEGPFLNPTTHSVTSRN